jgi:hypothetical protein
MKRLLICSLVMVILSLPTTVKAQEAPTIGGICDTVCLMEYKMMWFNRGCKLKVGYAC